MCMANSGFNTLPQNVEELINVAASYIQGGMCKEAAELAALANEGEGVCVIDD